MLIGYSHAAVLVMLLILGGCAGSSPSTPPAAADTVETATITQGAVPADMQLQANRGDLDSQFQLGSWYFVRQPKDLKNAEYWWKQAADKGHALAAVSLAFLYTGRDNPALNNPAQMLKYLSQSAAGNNPMAQHVLGNFYLEGEHGVPKDAYQAHALFLSACQQNYAPSCAALKQKP
ncbi:tetratricopeptide repeat protein [Pseudomonas sp. TMP25]|uniref:tetratricopeptide repeat protein n=1 Tax=Pseudomonas sp. TMP25 TaxID=3136561 RepID=UPI003100D163